jgi:hypothetical protein
MLVGCSRRPVAVEVYQRKLDEGRSDILIDSFGNPRLAVAL